MNISIKKNKLDKETLGLAGEYAVASELCKRNIYAQLTLGNRKRTDLLVDANNKMLRIQVKSKQSKEWPVKGITGNDIILVLVDFCNKPLDLRPDFYVLTSSDWAKVINVRCVQSGLVKKRRVSISDCNVPTWSDGFVGIGIMSEDVQTCKEKWNKIEKRLKGPKD